MDLELIVANSVRHAREEEAAAICNEMCRKDAGFALRLRYAQGERFSLAVRAERNP